MVGDVGGVAESTRVTGNHVEMVDLVDSGKRRMDDRQGKDGLNKVNMMGGIGLGGGRVITDVGTLGKQVAKEDTRGETRNEFVHPVRSKP